MKEPALHETVEDFDRNMPLKVLPRQPSRSDIILI